MLEEREINKNKRPTGTKERQEKIKGQKLKQIYTK
jgi:hypothetical protein